jgi:hypothetical protein
MIVFHAGRDSRLLAGHGLDDLVRHRREREADSDSAFYGKVGATAFLKRLDALSEPSARRASSQA